MKTNLKDFSLTPLGKVQHSTNRAGVKSVQQQEEFPTQWAGGGALVQEVIAGLLLLTSLVLVAPSAQAEIFSAISADGNFTCVLTSSGGVNCWGYNGDGALGDGTTTTRDTAVPVIGLNSPATAIDVGGYHACVITNGIVQCWGRNNYGQLGNGTTTNSTVAVTVSGLSGVTAISKGAHTEHTCVLTSNGVYCWGPNSYGQLGDGTTTDRYTPVLVNGLNSSEVKAIATGGDSGIGLNTCVLTNSGSVKCWGHNGDGQLGDGTTTDSLTPVDVKNSDGSILTGIVAIDTAGDYTCALTGSGAVKCWGNNNAGQLGDGSTTNRSAPVNVSGLNGGVIAIAVADQSCALFSGGSVKCWGLNDWGQVGDGTTTNRLTPVDINIAGVTAIATGGGKTCAITDNGSKANCWGINNTNDLGDGTNTNRSYPGDVIFTPDVMAVTLTVTKVGEGIVTAQGINCGTDCTETYALNTNVQLTAKTDAGYRFVQWSGDCSGMGTTTSVTMDAAKNCTATFDITWCPNSICNVSTGGSDTTGDGSEINPFATIQHGIDMAQEGYTVLVHAGTYVENISVGNKNITVKSKDGAVNTIIDGDQKASVVTFIHDGNITLGAAATLQGFTIIHGIGTPGNDDTYRTDFYAGDRLGGGILCHKTKPILTGLIITQNSAKRGGGIFGRGCEPTVINTVIGVNTALADGGGVGFVSGWLKHPTFKNVLIVENTATGNGGGMFMDYSTQAIMINSTISKNTSGYGHGGAIDRANQSGVNLTNSIIWDNGTAPLYWRGGTNYTSQISYSIVQFGQSATLINWGTGSIDTAPLFVGDGDYHLSSNSPALKAGTLSGAPTDDLEGLPRPNPIDSNPDMGAYEIPPLLVDAPVLTVTKTGNGVVASTPAGIICGADCTENYASGTVITLTATPDVGYVFKGWTVDCSGTNATTTVTMDAAKNCTANFDVENTVRLTPSPILTNSQMGTTTLNITLTGSCSSWTATTKPGGNITNLLVSPTSGTGNATITISYRKSSAVSPKKGNAKVIVTATCGTATVKKTVIIR